MHGAKKKKRWINLWGLLASLPPARCHVVFRRSTSVLRTTSDTLTEARTTGQLRDRQLAVVVTCLCIRGPRALPLVGSCLGKTCGVFDGLTASAHQNVRSYDVSFLQEINVIRPGIFFSINMNIKRLLYIGQSDACTTKLANGTRAALWAICCGSGCY